MFESAETGSRVDKKEYEAALDDLRLELLNAQFDLQKAPFSVLILLVGNDRWGVDDAVDILHEWMDARHIDTHFFGLATDEELERPRFWRYWRVLPAHGRIGIHIGAWTLGAIADVLQGKSDDADFEARLDHIRRFERALAQDGTLLLKFWCHIPKKEFEKRLKKAKKNPDLEVYVEASDWRTCKAFDEILPVSERLVERTSTAESPWNLVESTDFRHLHLTVARTLVSQLRARLDAAPPAPEPAPPETPDVPGTRGRLDTVDLTATIEKAEYKDELKSLQARFYKLVHKAAAKGIASIFVFEGWDAAGKGGAIRRMVRTLSARHYRIVPIAAPTEEEKAHHYLWRFWRQLPAPGKVVVFDRSWYGRVLVERVEGFARVEDWKRAYEEIVDFESQQVEHGSIVHKFLLHISPEEQLARFQERENTPYKRHKITDEDYRNRDKWDAYVEAIEEMVARTHTESCPWTLVPANDKRYARIQVLRTACKALADRLS